MGDGEKLLTHLNSALKGLLGLDIFPRVPKKKLNFVDQCYRCHRQTSTLEPPFSSCHQNCCYCWIVIVPNCFVNSCIGCELRTDVLLCTPMETMRKKQNGGTAAVGHIPVHKSAVFRFRKIRSASKDNIFCWIHSF